MQTQVLTGTTATTMHGLVRDAEAQAATKWDAQAKTTSMAAFGERMLRYQPEGFQASELFGNLPIGEQEGEMTEHALTQLNDRLGGPGKGWLVKQDGALRADVLNALLRHRPAVNVLARHDGSAIRAILSDQYTPLDNHEFLPMVEQAISELGSMASGAQVFRPELGDVLRAWVLFPGVTFGPEPDQPSGPQGTGGMHPAIWIRNSEIGTGGVRVHGGVYQAACNNGTILGWNSGEAFMIAHRHLSKATMQMTIADSLVVALRMSERGAELFRQAVKITLGYSKASDLVAEWSKKYGLTDGQHDTWLASVRSSAAEYGRAQDYRGIDLVNGATRAAQTFDADTREQAERMAGDLLAGLFALPALVERDDDGGDEPGRRRIADRPDF